MIAEGPFGAFTTAARRRPRVALIAGGVGITPIRALLEDMPGEPGDIAVVYRALRPEDVILRAELDELARRRGAELHYVVGDHREGALLSPEHLQRLVPDIAARDVYVCGPPAMTEATRATPGPLRRPAAPDRHRALRLLSRGAAVGAALPGREREAAVRGGVARPRPRRPPTRAGTSGVDRLGREVAEHEQLDASSRRVNA